MIMRSSVSGTYILLFSSAGLVVMAQYVGQVTFTLNKPKSLTPFQPRRLIDPGWGGVENLPECAYKTLQESSYPLGFLYSKTNKLCTPVVEFQEPGTDGSRQVDDHEGHLYLFKRDCPVGFQLYDTEEDGKTCIRVFKPLVNYENATTVCSSWGGHLAAVRSLAKRHLVSQLCDETELWIGLDDIEQDGQFIWQVDGSVLTDEELDTLFINPPDKLKNRERCCCVNADEVINDHLCIRKHGFICESHPTQR